MKTSSPEKLLKMLLCSLAHNVPNDIGIVLNGCSVRIVFVRKTASRMFFELRHVTSDNPSVDMPTEAIVQCFRIVEALNGDSEEEIHKACSRMSSFLCNAMKLYTMQYMHIKEEALCSLAQADVYILTKGN
jgi:hypothetical protein